MRKNIKQRRGKISNRYEKNIRQRHHNDRLEYLPQNEIERKFREGAKFGENKNAHF